MTARENYHISGATCHCHDAEPAYLCHFDERQRGEIL